MDFIRTDWQTSLPRTGDSLVSVVLDASGSVFCGSNGFVYELEPVTGSIVAMNGLSGLGNKEVQFALDGHSLYTGTNGYVVGLSTTSLSSELWRTKLPSGDGDKVNLVADGDIYAGCRGYVYKLNGLGHILGTNNLPNLGNEEVRLTLNEDGSRLYAGTYGHVIAIDTATMATVWTTQLSGVGVGQNVVSVLYFSGLLWAASNGWVFRLTIDDGVTFASRQVVPLFPIFDYETRLAVNPGDTALYAGAAGFVFGLGADLLEVEWQVQLKDSSFEKVNLVAADAVVYAGCRGRAYELDAATGAQLAYNSLPDRGDSEVRMAMTSDQSHLFLGTEGYAIGTSEFGAAVQDKSRWMEALSSELGPRMLRRVVLPGSHDSATSQITYRSELSLDQPEWKVIIEAIVRTFGLANLVKVVIANWAKAQGDPIGVQLRSGIRYLDLRISSRDSTELWTCHAMYSDRIEEVLIDVRNFVMANPKEIVLLDFQHFYGMDAQLHQDLVRLIETNLGSWLAPRDLGNDVTCQTLWDTDQRILVFYADDEVASANPFLWLRSSLDSPWPDVATASELKTALQSELPNNRDTFFVLQGVCTPDGQTIVNGLNPFSDAPGSLQSLADEVSPAVTQWVRDLWSYDNLNVVMVDWHQRCEIVPTVLLINRRGATPRPAESTPPDWAQRPRIGLRTPADLQALIAAAGATAEDVAAKVIDTQVGLNPEVIKALTMERSNIRQG